MNSCQVMPQSLQRSGLGIAELGVGFEELVEEFVDGYVGLLDVAGFLAQVSQRWMSWGLPPLISVRWTVAGLLHRSQGCMARLSVRWKKRKHRSRGGSADGSMVGVSVG